MNEVITEMKKMVVIILVLTLIMTSCSSAPPDVSSAPPDVSSGLPDIFSGERNRSKIFNVSSSYFDNYTSGQFNSAYIVKGTLHKEDDENTIITHIRAEKDIEITITGSLSSGVDTELVYVAPDGTETKIADNSSEIFEVTLNVVSGDGTVKFKGEPAIYDFEVQFELHDVVRYSDL